MLRLLAIVCLCYVSMFAQEYKINLVGNEDKENLSFLVKFEIDEQQKPLPLQKFDIRDIPKINSLKILTTPGLKGTLADEREFLIYYKTSLNISGLKIRNLYKAGIIRIYGGESEITIRFDKDHYQNVTSLLKYHNITSETLKDIDNLYGTWDEINFTEIEIKKSSAESKESKPSIKE